MKWTTPIWSDPVGWSEKVAKTRFRIFILLLFHIYCVLMGLLMINKLLQSVQEGQVYRISTILEVGAFPIVIGGVFLPALYMYAVYRLLRIIKEK